MTDDTDAPIILDESATFTADDFAVLAERHADRTAEERGSMHHALTENHGGGTVDVAPEGWTPDDEAAAYTKLIDDWRSRGPRPSRMAWKKYWRTVTLSENQRGGTVKAVYDTVADAIKIAGLPWTEDDELDYQAYVKATMPAPGSNRCFALLTRTGYREMKARDLGSIKVSPELEEYFKQPHAITRHAETGDIVDLLGLSKEEWEAALGMKLDPANVAAFNAYDPLRPALPDLHGVIAECVESDLKGKNITVTIAGIKHSASFEEWLDAQGNALPDMLKKMGSDMIYDEPKDMLTFRNHTGEESHAIWGVGTMRNPIADLASWREKISTASAFPVHPLQPTPAIDEALKMLRSMRDRYAQEFSLSASLIGNIVDFPPCQNFAMRTENAPAVIFSDPTLKGTVCFHGHDGKLFIKLKSDGSVEFGPGIAADEATRLFCDRLLFYWPAMSDVIRREAIAAERKSSLDRIAKKLEWMAEEAKAQEMPEKVLDYLTGLASVMRG